MNSASRVSPDYVINFRVGLKFHPPASTPLNLTDVFPAAGRGPSGATLCLVT